MQEGNDKPRHKIEFMVGELVRVKEGPFTDFNGSVEEVNYEKVACVFLLRSLAAQHRLNWSSHRLRKPKL